MEQDPLTREVIGCALEVHRTLGPGLLESAYQQCLAHELYRAGIEYRLEDPVPVMYKNVRIDCGYRVDMVVDGRLMIELKAVSQFAEIHQAQLLTYMKLAGMSTGLMINFNVRRLADGIRRFRL